MKIIDIRKSNGINTMIREVPSFNTMIREIPRIKTMVVNNPIQTKITSNNRANTNHHSKTLRTPNSNKIISGQILHSNNNHRLRIYQVRNCNNIQLSVTFKLNKFINNHHHNQNHFRIGKHEFYLE